MIRSEIEAGGLSAREIARRAGVSPSTVLRVKDGVDNLDYGTSIKLAKALDLDLKPASLEARPVEAPPVAPAEGPAARAPASPWDDWDVATCPVYVREDGHLVVFGMVKGRLRSRSRIAMVEELAGRYPGGGLDHPGLIRRFGAGAVAGFHGLKETDADTRAAFQPPGREKLGLYRFGRPDN